MQLIIDVGNTLVKTAIFKNDEILIQHSFELNSLVNEISVLCNPYSIQKAIVSSVGRLSTAQKRFLTEQYEVSVLDHNTPLPFYNDYGTPQTLGVDRIALVAGFVKYYSGKTGLIIDAGTCITFDFIDSARSYKGGAISPGIRLRYESLHNYTANLPLLEKAMPETIIGTTTNSAIHSGVIHSVLLELDGVIDAYKAQYNVDTVLLTGGDAQFLAKRLKNSIFAHSNLLLEGLNYILTHSDD